MEQQQQQQQQNNNEGKKKEGEGEGEEQHNSNNKRKRPSALSPMNAKNSNNSSSSSKKEQSLDQKKKKTTKWISQASFKDYMHDSSVNCLRVLRDGTVASGSMDCSLKLWHSNGSIIAKLDGHSLLVRAIVELKDGTIASCSNDGQIRFWNRNAVESNSRNNNNNNNNNGNNGSDTSTNFGKREFRNMVARVSNSSLNSKNEKALAEGVSGGECFFTINAHGDWICCLIDVVRKKNRRRKRYQDALNTLINGHDDSNNVSNDTELVEMQMVDDFDDFDDGRDEEDRIGEAILREIEQNERRQQQLLMRQEQIEKKKREEEKERGGEEEEEEEEILMSGSWDRTIKAWSNRGECVKTWNAHSPALTLCELQRDDEGEEGLMIASGLIDNTIRVWSWYTDACCATLYGHTRGVSCVVRIEGTSSSSPPLMASCSWDTTIRIWNYKRGVCLRVLTGHTQDVHSIIQLKHGYCDNKSKKKSDERHNRRDRLVGSSDSISDNYNSIAEGEDGMILASGSGDETLRLWEVKSGICIDQCKTAGRMFCLAETSDGSIVGGFSDGMVALWQTYDRFVLPVMLCYFLFVIWANVFNNE